LTVAISIVAADVSRTCHAIPHCITCPYDGANFACTQCENLYAIDANNRCTACKDISGCSQCRSTKICDVCYYPTVDGPDMSGYATCSACAPNCRNCTISGSGNCDYCKPGYYVTSDQKCSNCPSNCKICTPGAIGSTACTACNDGFTNNGGTTACVAMQCGPNCGVCVNGVCQSCADGLKISPTGSCVCAPNCNSCVNTHYGYCDDGQCATGYKGTAAKTCAPIAPLSTG